MSYETPVPEDDSTGTGDEIPAGTGTVGPGVAEHDDTDDAVDADEDEEIDVEDLP